MGDDVEDAYEWITILQHLLSLCVIDVLSVVEELDPILCALGSIIGFKTILLTNEVANAG